MPVYLLSCCCTKPAPGGRVLHHEAIITAAPSPEEACKHGYRTLLETHPFAAGWGEFDVCVEVIPTWALADWMREATAD
jgi:hypothetical protein